MSEMTKQEREAAARRLVELKAERKAAESNEHRLAAEIGTLRQSMPWSVILMPDGSIESVGSGGSWNYIEPDKVIDLRPNPPAPDFAAKEQAYETALRASEKRIRELEAAYEELDKRASTPPAGDAAARLAVLIQSIKDRYGHGWGAPARDSSTHQMLQEAVAVAEFPAPAPVPHPAEARVAELEAQAKSFRDALCVQQDRIWELEAELVNLRAASAAGERVQALTDAKTDRLGVRVKELEASIRTVCRKIDDENDRIRSNWLHDVRCALLKAVENVPPTPLAQEPKPNGGWIDGLPTHEGEWLSANDGNTANPGRFLVHQRGGSLTASFLNGLHEAPIALFFSCDARRVSRYVGPIPATAPPAATPATEGGAS